VKSAALKLFKIKLKVLSLKMLRLIHLLRMLLGTKVEVQRQRLWLWKRRAKLLQLRQFLMNLSHKSKLKVGADNNAKSQKLIKSRLKSCKLKMLNLCLRPDSTLRISN
jgi:hypothetical protein